MSITERSIIAYQHAREGAQRFEYFVCGVSLALCGYIGQTLKPQKLGSNPQTLEVASLLLLVTSVIISFVRLDQSVRLDKRNQTLLDLAEKRRKLIDILDAPAKPLRDETGEPISAEEARARIPGLTRKIDAIHQDIDAIQARQIARFWWRNGLLAAGFVGIILAKILGAYFPVAQI